MSRFKLLITIMYLCVVSITVLAAGPAFPGPARRAKAEGNMLLLENDLLAVRWDLTDGLYLVEAKDKQNGQSL